MRLVPRLPKARWILVSGISLAMAALEVSVSAQAPAGGGALPADQQAMVTGGELIDKGDLKGAAAQFEKVANDTGSQFAGAAKLRLGYVYFRMGEHDKAVKALRESANTKDLIPELKELAMGLIPQVLTSKASSLPATAPARKSAFEEAVNEFDKFLAAFPRSDEVESSNYSKAVALYQLERYADAVTPLRFNVQNFQGSQSALDSQYLLALTMGTQANIGAKNAKTKEPEVEKNYDNSEKMLIDVVNKGIVTDVALSNDARYQIGEMLFARAGFSKDEAASKVFFQRALDAYRSVLQKELVLAAQKNRMDRIKALRPQAMLQRDTKQVARLDRLLDREREKDDALKAKPDQTIAAKLKIAEIYFCQEKFDESRVLLNFVKPVAQDEEQKKEISYYTALTLAAQNMQSKVANPTLDDRVEATYTEFRSTYKNDPIGENLSLMAGGGFVDRQPAKAVKYFDDQVKLYPKSALNVTAQAQMATAYSRLGQNDEALKKFHETLGANPNKEVAAAADFGIATILMQTKKTPEAIAQFKVVREKHAGTPQAEQAAYYVGQLTFETGDSKNAIVELQAFIKSYPKNELMPEGLFFLAQAQKAQNLNQDALASFKELAEKFPQSKVGPFSYFERARILMLDTKTDDVIALMQEFIKKYPDAVQLYQAYDFVAQIEVNQKHEDRAIASYEDFVKSKPEEANAPKALLRVANIYKDQMDKLGRYSTLGEKIRPLWTAAVEGSMSACERLVRAYPDADEVALALKLLLDDHKARVQAKLETDDDVEKIFQGLSKEFAAKPATRSKVVFTLAAHIFDKDQKKAVELMSGVYKPDETYAPEDLDLYSSALIDQKKLDDAEKVFLKLARDFPIADGSDPTKAPTSIQIAQSISIFGLGKVLQERGKMDEAKVKFDELEKLYGWSPKMLEANYGIALSLSNEKKYDDALKRLVGLANAAKAPAELRAKGMFLIARIHEDMTNFDDAVANYRKIDSFYGGVPKVASEGLWRAAQLLEKQATGALPIATPPPRIAPAAKPGAPAAGAPPAKK